MRVMLDRSPRLLAAQRWTRSERAAIANEAGHAENVRAETFALKRSRLAARIGDACS
jgi:hypothetical protein